MGEVASEKVLLVDDDPAIRNALGRVLHRGGSLAVTGSGTEGLRMLAGEPSFAVVIAHSHLPEMSGAEFLARVSERSPDAVRIMVTGSADLHIAIDAINDGHIFRFLTKPCPDEVLSRALQLSIRQYRLHTAEQDLLGKTLHGLVELLTELMGMVNPLAFSEATRVKRYVRHLALNLGLPQVWEYEVAAMLSQVGCVTLPPEVLGKVFAGVPMTPAEQQSYADYPRISAQLLRHIPRLDRVVRMIEAKDSPFRLTVLPDHLAPEQQVALGGHLLKVCLAYDRQRLHGATHDEALQLLRNQSGAYDATVLNAFTELAPQSHERYRTALAVNQLTAGMVLMEDVRSRSGMLLVARGEEISHAILMRLRAFAENVGVKEPVQVLIRIPEPDARAGH